MQLACHYSCCSSIKEKISNEERDRNNKHERTNKTPWERVVVEGEEVGSGRSWRFIIVVAERLAITLNQKKKKFQESVPVVGGGTQLACHRGHHTRI